MRGILQRVTRASVSVDGEVIGECPGPGALVLVGVTHEDTLEQAKTLARKIAELRIFEDETSIQDRAEEASVLVVSQFTLYGDVRKGRRPSWSKAAPGPVAEPLVDAVVEELRNRGIHVETGRFGAMMSVELVNDGPYTLVIEV
ncbi:MULTISPECIES: D-aminoacyl-tRNA deacylase [Actinomycetaceae]|jgi:D-tyrosyl-tRNA(Tyr) deacylase|uniref:D-aminoacyl-tRNA deacylase n=1 Tax=Actinomycetaceae TaxID=2049 RepID=UPI00065FE961|nr:MULTISPECIES: D-aminoacyl-tRNA deacylase [Actinomycetaceae]MBF0973381.1 D-tyrosyl-tRNA(Tyr) deacylase [Actinomyces sp.]MDU2259674.1 D-aminoacyl-tRNA deacylase [Actinomyces sp.]